jgi:CRP-like cAMP-binding protein
LTSRRDGVIRQRACGQLKILGAALLQARAVPGLKRIATVTTQLFNSSEKRLARMLLLLANFGKEGTPEPMIAKISQETLAEMIGTTRSRVSFFMNKFRKLGYRLQRRH